jgi:hypothetical protein
MIGVCMRACILLAFLTLVACDLSQRTPVTDAGAMGSAVVERHPNPAGSVSVEVSLPAHEVDTASASSTGEKSIRLVGRGVSRKLQIRI